MLTELWHRANRVRIHYGGYMLESGFDSKKVSYGPAQLSVRGFLFSNMFGFLLLLYLFY
jgi:hypothetical protein